MPTRWTTASTNPPPPTVETAEAADPENAALAKRIAHKGIWVEPKLLAEIEYRAKSAEERSGTRSSKD
ncbi:hypothetical protein XH79_09500 [Bradyrhizobium sp. CCBAU 45389]|nr:hypothetical protein [Bradyrhizobium sp. CCBAU 45389]